MVNYLERCKIFYIILCLAASCVFLSNCSDTEYKSITLNDYRFDKDDTSITLGFKLQNKIYQRKIDTQTKSISIIRSSELFSVEHDSSFCTKIQLSNNNIHIYFFPNSIVTDNHNSYEISDAMGVYAFFIEYYDSVAERNYYIFSKDKIIQKETEINNSGNYLEKLQELGDKDIGFYNEDTQSLSYPYAGYVIKDSDGKFQLLSTLWDNYTIN